MGSEVERTARTRFEAGLATRIRLEKVQAEMIGCAGDPRHRFLSASPSFMRLDSTMDSDFRLEGHSWSSWWVRKSKWNTWRRMRCFPMYRPWRRWRRYSSSGGSGPVSAMMMMRDQAGRVLGIVVGRLLISTEEDLRRSTRQCGAVG